MSVNSDLFEVLVKSSSEKSLEGTIQINDSTYAIYDIVITNSSIPVNEPTTRGGVYFSDKFAYKINGQVNDLSIVPLLTRMMLGPNTEFGKLKIHTKIKSDKEFLNVEISTNLVNSIQTSNSINLCMIIVNLKSV